VNKDSKIYVAGHKGLVGSAIYENLMAQGYSNLIVKSKDELDLTNGVAVQQYFETEKPEFVFLAAAKVGGIAANHTYRADFIYENLMIQNHVIHQSYLHGVKKLLFLGSTCVYPKNAPQPIKEESMLMGELEYTNEPYAIAKIAGMKMCESYNIQHGTNFISVMPTNLYGPRDNFDFDSSHVLPALLRKIHLGKLLENNNWDAIRKDLNLLPVNGVNGNQTQENILNALKNVGIDYHQNKTTIEIWGSGKPRREFLWSEDMADACVFIMNTLNFSDCISDTKEIKNSHLNIGTGSDISISDLAVLIKNETGFMGDFTYNTEKPDGTIRKLTDVGKLSSLGWKSKRTLEAGLRELYKWYIDR